MAKKKMASKGLKRQKAPSYVDAMAIKDGYVARAVTPEELYVCNDRYGAAHGPYEFEPYAAMKGKMDMTEDDYEGSND